MMYQPFGRTRRYRMLLLGTLLLYFGGVVVEPLAHAFADAGSEAAAAWQNGDGGAPGGDDWPAAGEHDCVACKVYRVHALPAAAMVAAVHDAADEVVFHTDTRDRAPPPSFPSRPRPPPIS